MDKKILRKEEWACLPVAGNFCERSFFTQYLVPVILFYV